VTEPYAFRMAGPDHAVISLRTPAGTHTGYRRTPCGGCPWRVETAGDFPAEAFVHSARTAYDAATEEFACHESGDARPQTCAGFLLRNSVHNLATRMRLGRVIDLAQVHEGDAELWPSYRGMAEANGVPADHPALERCRADHE
jgi:hypothetical protein